MSGDALNADEADSSSRQERLQNRLAGTRKWSHVMGLMVRQGDVLVRQIEVIPDAVSMIGTKIGSSVLSRTTFTGHDHYIPHGTFTFYAEDLIPEFYPAQRKYLKVEVDDIRLDCRRISAKD
jgi:hypothetical protein